MTTLEWALRYIERGWSVIPIAPGTKAPPEGFILAPYLDGFVRMGPGKRPADNPSYWWGGAYEGRYDIAIVTGAPSGLVVADVDPRNGGSFAGIPLNGPVAETRNFGRHYYYRLPSEDVRSGPIGANGTDRKAGGGYVLAPPSPGYTWLEGQGPQFDVPECPAWLLEGPRSDATEPAQPWVATTLGAPHLCPPGAQHDTLVRLCWWAAGHLEYDIALGMLLSWARQLPLAGRPWTQEDVRTRLESAYAKRVPEAGRAGPLVDGPGGTARPSLRDGICAARAYTKKVSERATSDWLVPDLVSPGCWTELLGTMKEGKSTLGMGMVAALIEGREFLGRQTRQSNVLYLSEQAGPSLVATLQRGSVDQAENLFILTAAETHGTPWSDVCSSLIALAGEYQCGLLVVDTLSGLASIENEDDAASLAYLNALIPTKSRGIAVLFIRHSRKSGGAINVVGRGSGAITGAMDICLRIEATQGVASPYRHLEIVSRLTGVSDEHLSYEGGTYVLGQSPGEARSHAKMDPVIALLSSRGPAGATAEDIAAEIKADVRTARRRLDELDKLGRVVIFTNPADKRRVLYALRPAVE